MGFKVSLNLETFFEGNRDSFGLVSKPLNNLFLPVTDIFDGMTDNKRQKQKKDDSRPLHLNLKQLVYKTQRYFQLKTTFNNIMISPEGIEHNMTPEEHLQTVKQLKRKMKIMKEAVIEARQTNTQLQGKLYTAHDNCRKKETDSKLRDDKNQSLLLEIRVLRDALIAEKNQTQEIERKLKMLAEGKGPQSQGILSSTNYFGLGSLFQR